MPNILLSAKGVIIDKDKFLILKNTRPTLYYWELPGGRIQYGETPEKALLREIKEETDIDIETIKLLGTYWFFSPTNKHQVFCLTYLCKPKRMNVDITNNPDTEQIKEYRWVTKEEFLQENYTTLHESLKKLISESL